MRLTPVLNMLFLCIHFSALLRAVSGQCTDKILSNARGGTFQSPRFPSPYPHDSRCSYQVKAKPGNYIEVKFISFNLQDRVNGRLTDYLTIYDGEKRKRFFGANLTPFKYISTKNNIRLIFVSDSSITFKGFKAEYRVRKESERCMDRVMTNKEDSFHSPGYPSNYPADTDCDYVIVAEEGQRVEITFQEFQLKPRDFVKISERWNDDDPKVVYFHGNEIAPFKFVSETNKVWLNFVSHGKWLTDKGFAATYTVLADSEMCKDNIMMENEGSFHSPGFPTRYPANFECDYVIVVEEGYHIEITFQEFQLEDRGGSSGDHVKVLERWNEDNPKIIFFNGHQATPLKFATETNMVWLSFVTYGEGRAAKGFTATYKAVKTVYCGGDVIVVTNGEVFCVSDRMTGLAEFCHVTCDLNYKLSGSSTVSCNRESSVGRPFCFLPGPSFILCGRNISHPECPYSAEEVAEYFAEDDVTSYLEDDITLFDDLYDDPPTFSDAVSSRTLSKYGTGKPIKCHPSFCIAYSGTKTYRVHCKKYGENAVRILKARGKKLKPNQKMRSMEYCWKCQKTNCGTVHVVFD